MTIERHRRNDESARGGPPVGVSEDSREHVRREDGRHGEEQVLEPMEALAQDNPRDQQGGQRHADVATHVGKLECCGDARQLGARGADIRDHERAERNRGWAAPEALSDERHQPFPGDDAHSGPELVESDQRPRGQGKHPQE